MLGSTVAALVKFVSFSTQSVFAQEAAAAAPAQPPAWMQLAPMAVLILVFYFLIIRPQSKRNKEKASFNQSLKVGDQVITQTGLFGKITGLNEHIANLEIANGVQIKIMRAQIATLQSALQNSETAK
ncbi:MAG: preprotein translocase subunit YajC [Pseudobdellovibrio sp.]